MVLNKYSSSNNNVLAVLHKPSNTMVAEKFTFCWDQYDTNVPQTFKQLWQNQDFADVTLATKDDVQIRAHKVILSASSPIFQNILKKNPHSNPLIYFNNLKSADVKLLLRFIYLGQCEVSQNGLVDFLAAGKELMVKGLVEEEVNIDQSSQNDQISAKAEILNSDTELGDEDANNISSTFETDENEPMIDPIGPDIYKYCDINVQDEVSDFLSEEAEIYETQNIEEDISQNDVRNRKDAKTAAKAYNRVMFDHAHKNGEIFIPFDEATKDDLIKKLPTFFETVVKVNGDVYSTDSLKAMFNGLALNLVSRKNPMHLKTSQKFEPVRSVLKTMCAKSVKLGRGPGYSALTLDKYLSCDRCNFKSSSQQNMQRHKKNHGRNSTEEPTKEEPLCTKCEYKATDFERLKTHILYVHSGASFLCDKCDFKSETPGNVKNHFESEHPGQPLPTNVTMILPNH